MDSEMYLGDLYRVVRSPEEQSKFGAAGWKDAPDPNVKKYKPHTAVEPQKIADIEAEREAAEAKAKEDAATEASKTDAAKTNGKKK